MDCRGIARFLEYTSKKLRLASKSRCLCNLSLLNQKLALGDRVILSSPPLGLKASTSEESCVEGLTLIAL
jgi:hypothetical protein